MSSKVEDKKPAGADKAAPKEKKQPREKKPEDPVDANKTTADKPPAEPKTQTDAAKPAAPKRDSKPKESSEYKVKGSADPEPKEAKEPKTADGKPRERRERKERPEGATADGERKPRERKPRAEGDDEKRERPPRKEKPKREFDKEWRAKIVVTLETEVPPMPKDVLPKPTKEQLEDNLKFCDRKMKEYEDQIEDLKKKREQWNEDQRKKRDLEREDRLKKKDEKNQEWEDNKHLFEDHKNLKTKFEKISKKRDEVEAELKEAQTRLNEVEKGFVNKSSMSAEKVKEEIEKLDRRLQTERLTGNEEKTLIGLREQLSKNIPLSAQYSKIMAEIKLIKDRRKVILDEWNPLYNQKKKLGDQIKIIVEKRKAEEEANPKKKEEGKDKDAPKEGADGKEGKDGKREHKLDKDGKRIYDDPFSKKIDELYDFKKQQYKKKDTIRDEFDKTWDKYLEQQQFIREIEHMAKVKDRLKKIEEVKERKARARRYELIEEFIEKNTPTEDTTIELKQELAATELLVGHLTAMLPSNKRLFAAEVIEDDIALSAEQLAAKLTGNKAFAGLKLAVKTKEDLAPAVAQKKKDKRKKDDKKPAPAKEDAAAPAEVEDPNEKIVFELDIRNAFSQVKIEPPELIKDIEDVLITLDKKKGQLEKEIKEKDTSLEALKRQAEASVPSIEQLKELFKDVPKDDDRPRDRSRKERRGTRGGADNVQWKGKQHERHAKKEGDFEKERHRADEEFDEERAPKQDKRKQSRHQEYSGKPEEFPSL